ncbi:MAG: FumA C-terminus/TtdB family hydratase beta subunit [Candidatus Bathyarchaeia archaeon]
MATYHLKTPISEGEVRKLRVGDVIYVSGNLVTARDQAHKRALEFLKDGRPLPVNLEGLALYHCGPLVKRKGDKWVVISAGPTTSTRMDIFEAEFIRNFRVRLVIGKGGMGWKTASAMAEYGAVYGAFTGGAAVLAAKAIKGVKGVEWTDLGIPEAMWILDVENLGPLIVAIDSHGRNLFMETAQKAEMNRNQIYAKLGL